MGNTFTALYVHVIFSTKGRAKTISSRIRPRLHAYLGGIARNLVHRLITYATGAPVSFADRTHVERILDQTESSHFGVRSLIHAITESPLFQEK